jgi:streptogramin lyase
LPKLFLEGWGSGQFDLEDCEGKWWIPTGEGLFRFPRTHRLEDLSHTPPEAHFTEKNGLAGRDVFRLFEDSKGNLWISTLDAAPENLTRWERSTKRFLRYGEKDGLPVASSPTAFLESKRGDLWIGHSAGHVTRRRNGRFTPVRVPEGMARSIVNRLLFDRRGRLWIATTRGLFLCNDPSADSPEIVGFGNGGFSSAGIRWIEEDSFGRLYAVTSRGIDRFDPDTGRIWHVTTSQGIPLSSMLAGLRDGNGNLWFGGIQGVMRLAPLPENSELSPPVVRIDGLRIAGRSLPFSATGEQAVGGLTLAPTERQIEITWVGISQDAAEPPTFEYRLQPSQGSHPAGTLFRSGHAPQRPGHRLPSSLRFWPPSGRPGGFCHWSHSR